ncbi:dihydroorotase [Fulvivirgaceae bacterium BMA12]|uniref:Dihydroorotase n=1 Tax=Agaribacillus aureus TaxID=3051825 RepID=A0ABT8LDK3_9BACT|nr:dihydroorotase [Fulvivirgaceae bacterium BMA12]
MDIVLNSVEIFDKRSPYHGKRKNVHIKNGVITSITSQKVKARQTVDAKGLKLSIGWFDVGAHFGDPGFEHKENLESGRSLAEKSGFTGVAVLPNTNPVVQSKNEVSYITSNNKNELIQLYALGAVSANTEGKELTEMIDLHHAGAVGFTDGFNPIWHTDILLKTLQYLQKFDGLLINRAEDRMLTMFGSMHEGTQSTLLGLKGMPGLAEEVMVQRDLRLLDYAGGRIHFSNISTAGSVDLIRKAKKKGLAVTCDVAVHQIAFSDKALEDYDTNFKVNPPFRENGDIKALIKGLKDGTIDLIVSSHCPQDEESKNLEFDLADFGIIGLQTFMSVIKGHYQDLSLEELIQGFTTRPREILGLPLPEIKVGSQADLTLFDPDKKWDYTLESNLSKSRNSPFLGKTLTGKSVGVFNNGKVYLDEGL